MAHPLAGKRIVATRAEGQSAEFVALLREVGATPIVFPTIEIAPLEDYSELDQALNHLSDYEWIIFTSINGVRSVLDRLHVLGRPATVLNGSKVAAVGPATEATLRREGVEIALRPAEYVAEAIIAALLESGPVAGKRFLLLRVDVARAVLRDQLVAAGALVDEVSVYRTVIGNPGPEAYAALRAGVDVITFTSSQTVRNFFKLLGDEAIKIATKAKVTCIGPITAQTAREMGLSVDVVAEAYTVRGLMAALERFMAEG